jgi:hypothetical protein
MKAYRVKGTTDESTECDLCGRVELKATVMLVPLDADGNDDGEVNYFGRSCAAKAAGWTVRELNANIKRAADEERERKESERLAVREAETEFLRNWYTEHYGTPDLHEAAKRAGLSPVRTSDPAIHALREAQRAGTVPGYRD